MYKNTPTDEITNRINRDERRNSLPYARSTKPEEVRARNKAYGQLRKQIDLETRAEKYCNYRGMGYVPNRRQVELCGAEAAGPNQAIGSGGATARGDVVDYLRRTRKRLDIV